MSIPQRFTETGQINYETFAACRKWQDGNRQLPTWENLPDDQKTAWREAAHAVIQKGWVSGRTQ